MDDDDDGFDGGKRRKRRGAGRARSARPTPRTAAAAAERMVAVVVAAKLQSLRGETHAGEERTNSVVVVSGKIVKDAKKNCGGKTKLFLLHLKQLLEKQACLLLTLSSFQSEEGKANFQLRTMLLLLLLPFCHRPSLCPSVLL